MLLQASASPTTEIARQASAAASTAISRVQAAAQSTANAMSSHQLSDSQSGGSQQGNDSYHSTDSQQDHAGSSQGRGAVSPGSSGAVAGAANGPAPVRAKQALLQRIAMVKDSYRGDDCTCFDTTLGCMLKVLSATTTPCVMLDPACLSVCLSDCLSVCPFVCVSVYLPPCLPSHKVLLEWPVYTS